MKVGQQTENGRPNDAGGYVSVCWCVSVGTFGVTDMRMCIGGGRKWVSMNV